jgi:hypothetical protein
MFNSLRGIIGGKGGISVPATGLERAPAEMGGIRPVCGGALSPAQGMTPGALAPRLYQFRLANDPKGRIEAESPEAPWGRGLGAESPVRRERLTAYAVN